MGLFERLEGRGVRCDGAFQGKEGQQIPIITDEFVQQISATVWTINHNMGLKPNVKLEDLVGNDIQGAIDFIDNNTVRVTFNQAVAGIAYLS